MGASAKRGARKLIVFVKQRAKNAPTGALVKAAATENANNM